MNDSHRRFNPQNQLDFADGNTGLFLQRLDHPRDRFDILGRIDFAD
jgi:hypothetical protein